MPMGVASRLEEALAAELSARAGGEPLTATQLAEQFAAEAIERDRYRPGLAAELSVQYGGPQSPGSTSYATSSSTSPRPRPRRPARRPTGERTSPWPPCASVEAAPMSGRAVNAARQLADPAT
jgi:hypothetical protein